MMQKPATDSEPPDREAVSFWMRFQRGIFWKRLRLGASLMAVFVVMYLFATGPLLWSDSHIENASWRSFVKLTMTPIVKLDYYHRFGKFTPDVPRFGKFTPNGTLTGDPLFHPWWISVMKSYWMLYGVDASVTYDLLYIRPFLIN